MTWHQWHHTAPMSSRMGLFSRCAVAKASSPHSCHWIGWCIAERKYADEARASELVGSVINFQSSREEQSASCRADARADPIFAQNKSEGLSPRLQAASPEFQPDRKGTRLNSSHVRISYA